MKTKRIAIGLALVVSTQICSAQDLPNIVPPTPEAASIGKYGDIPIGLNTGVPQISIPLVNFKVKVDADSSDIELSRLGNTCERNRIESWFGMEFEYGWYDNATGKRHSGR